MDEKANEISTAENFIEKCIPIRIQSQLSETLTSVLKGNQLKRLENFEMEKFQELHEVILYNEGDSNLKKLMAEIVEKILREKQE